MLKGKVFGVRPCAEALHAGLNRTASVAKLRGLTFSAKKWFLLWGVVISVRSLIAGYTCYSEVVSGITWRYEVDDSAPMEAHITDWSSLPAMNPVPSSGVVDIPAMLGGRVVTSIGSLGGRTQIKVVNIPSGVRIIKDGAFSGNSGMETVVIPAGVKEIGNYAFQGCSSLQSITLPSTVESIGYAAFRRCTCLESMVIPIGVDVIGEEMFKECSSLSSVEIPNTVTGICDAAFMDCSALITITIPPSVREIGYSVFDGCANLNTLSLSEGLKRIHTQHFQNTGLTTLTIPASVEEIGGFESSEILKTVNFLGNAPMASSPYFGSPNVVSYVKRGSTGWVEEDSAEIPETWEGRPIRWMDGSSGGGTTPTEPTKPVLEPYTPEEWSAPIVFSKGSDSTSAESTSFKTSDDIYVKIAVGTVDESVVEPFRVSVYVNGDLYWSEDYDGLEKDYYLYVTGIYIGTLGEGTYTVKMVIDSGGDMSEVKEDNVYTRTLTVEDPAEYTIFFYRNGENGDRDVSWTRVGIGETYVLPTAASLRWSRDGDTFLGWATSETARVAQYAEGQGVKNLSTTKGTYVSLYGVWQKRVSSAYTVNFDANGGTGGTTRMLPYGTAVGTLPTPVRSGYIFDGWYTTADGGRSISALTVITGEVTYYAHWTEISSDNFILSGAFTADKARQMHGAAFYYYNPIGVLVLKTSKANKKGIFTLSGSLTTKDGKKHAFKPKKVKVTGSVITVSGVVVRGIGTLTLRLAANGFSGTFSNEWTARTANVATLPKGELTFALRPYPTTIKGVAVRTDFLPLEICGSSDGQKITFPRAGRVSCKKGQIFVSEGGANNPSGLKLKFMPRSGTVKGTFYIYTFDGKRLKKWTAKVTGVVADGEAVMAVSVGRVRFATQMEATLR